MAIKTKPPEQNISTLSMSISRINYLTSNPLVISLIPAESPTIIESWQQLRTEIQVPRVV